MLLLDLRFRRRRGSGDRCARPHSGYPPASLAGSGADRCWGVPPTPPPKRAPPSLDSPAGWRGRAVLRFPTRRGARLCAPTHSGGPLASLAGSGAESGGGTPNTQPWRAPPSLDSPAGWEPSLRSAETHNVSATVGPADCVSVVSLAHPQWLFLYNMQGLKEIVDRCCAG